MVLSSLPTNVFSFLIDIDNYVKQEQEQEIKHVSLKEKRNLPNKSFN